ncbi:hypothetical protein QYF68_26645 [Mycolicibacterium austroafricanum]|uniref:Uncharacterized protein n=1 Tax=Mycolicibacterium austroafricanum TaxID=39687 RepID=A0ABT8HKT4_MYCAO|nr:hypothetical protein [Mycolicibacterium austroafricanum]MDN4521373.1 hypothetical protein [Mycolicibacterium austroafricanum]
MPISVSVNCPLCPGALSIPVEIEIETVSRLAQRAPIDVNISAEISDEGREVIAEHLRVAHPEAS